MIQFAKDRRSGLQYALKFFLSRSTFNDEAALYTDDTNPLGQFLPHLRNIAGVEGHDPAIVDPDGTPLPPCIVMEKGESLDVWMQRNRGGVDMVTGLQVCACRSSCYQQFVSYNYRCLQDILSTYVCVMCLQKSERKTASRRVCYATTGNRTGFRALAVYGVFQLDAVCSVCCLEQVIT